MSDDEAPWWAAPNPVPTTAAFARRRLASGVCFVALATAVTVAVAALAPVPPAQVIAAAVASATWVVTVVSGSSRRTAQQGDRRFAELDRTTSRLAARLGVGDVHVSLRPRTHGALNAHANPFARQVVIDQHVATLPDQGRNAVLCHEIGHLAAPGYRTQRAIMWWATTTATIVTACPAVTAAVSGRPVAAVVWALATLAVRAALTVAGLPTVRIGELEADWYAGELGYARALAETFSGQRPSARPPWLSTHPPHDQRIALLARHPHRH